MKGSYILVIFLKANSIIKIGSLGRISFPNGYYLYVGSGMGNFGSTTLINRIKRHLLNSDQKKLHWHIDYLLKNTNSIITQLYLIPSLKYLECIIAQELGEISEDKIKNFGSSDCKCKSHLFYFKELRDFSYK